MSASCRNRARAQVVIVGAGVAGLECALALRALAGQSAEVTLISPSPRFRYRPAASAEAFANRPEAVYDLGQIATDLGARFQAGAVEAVPPRRQSVRLASGGDVGYDALVLTVGARPVTGVPGALTFRDQRDVPRFRGLLEQLGAGRLQRLVFAVPSRRCWSLPAYELAFQASLYAVERSVAAQITIVTPEPEPLAMFGPQSSRRVGELLAEREIRFLGGAHPHSVGHDGALMLEFDGSVPADCVVAVPELQAPPVPGVPASWSGFLPVDAGGRVEGTLNVYAAGDITTYPIKQGGLAAQQADRVAQTIAAELGAEVKEIQETQVLRARLLTGDGALVLRTELDSLGRPTPAALQHHESRSAEIPKIFGRYLTPYLSMYESRIGATAGVA